MKRKMIRALSAVMLLVLMPVLASAASFAVVQGGTLNLRQSPSINSKSLGSYGTGSWVQVNKQSTGGFYSVKTMDGMNGYMMGSYLDFEQGSANNAVVKYAQGGFVNMRSGPSLDYAVVTRLTCGTSVTILNDSYEWNYVRASGYEGYVHDSLLERDLGKATVTTRNGGAVNVRSGPSSHYSSLGSVKSGAKLIVLKKGSGWYKVSVNGMTGYMSTDYISGAGGGTSTSTTAWVNNPRSSQVLNLREYASQNARSIGQYRNGTQVKVVNKDTTWCEVYVGTRHGYMMTRYLSFSKHVITPNPYEPTPYVPVYITPTPYYPIYVTPTPAPTVQYITPVPSSGPSAGTQGTLAVASGSGATMINVYSDITMTQFKAAYAPGTKCTILQYGGGVAMVLVDGSVGYVSTWNLNY